MAHKCSKCIYVYLVERIKTKDVYNALTYQYEKWPIVKELKEACGFNAESIILDDNQCRCGNYKENK